MRARVRETLLGMTVWAVAALGPLAGRSVEPVQADSPAAPEPRSPKNVILITVSTLGADHVGVLGYNRDTTPIFDSFGEENVLFRKAFASSGWMMPAHGSIFTSLYPGRHGATHIENSLDEASYTLAEILKDNGYYCVGFCCNPRLDNEHGFAQGFDIYDDYSVSVMLDAMAFGIGQDTDINRRRTNDLINDAAIRWLQNNTHQPFFMFVHYYDNHWDYLPPPPYDKLYDPNYEGPIDGTQIAREPLYSNPPSARDIEHIVALYDGEVKQTDNDLGELLEFLADKGLLDNSIVIVAGDHGEQFYEHGHTSHQGLFEELIHVPLAVSIPGTKTKGKTIDALVSQVDILPTILDYLQIPAPAECHGKSLKSVIEGDAEQVNDFIFAEYTGGAVSDIYTVRSARYKYYEGVGEEFAYDLLKDPAEQHRILPADFPDEVKQLRAQRSSLAASLDQTGVTSVEALIELEKLLDVLLLSPHRMDAEAKKKAEEAVARLVAMGDTVIPSLIARFNRPGQDFGFRHRAVKVLQAIGTPAAQKALLEIALAKDQEFPPNMKEWAASAFIATLDNKSEAARLLESDEDRVHNAGLRAIAGQGLDAALLERVAQLLASDNHTVRGNAAKVMSKDPSTGFVQTKVDALINAIARAHTFPKADDTYQNTYFTYAEMELNTYIRALSEMAGALAVMRYRRPALSGVPHDALAIAGALQGDASTLSDLRAILSDPTQGMMRLWAARSITKIGTEQDIALLQTIAETDTVVRQYYPSFRPPDADHYYPVRHAAQRAVNRLKARLQIP